MDYWMKLFFFASNIFVSIYDTRNIIDTFQKYKSIYKSGEGRSIKENFVFKKLMFQLHHYIPIINYTYVIKRRVTYRII